MFLGPLDESILGRARKSGLIEIDIHNLRDFSTDKHKNVDARPFGGGPGMVLRPEPLFGAVESLASSNTKRIFLTPSGKKFNQNLAQILAGEDHLLLVCGSYEGFDERATERLADEEISIGDFVLTNGALPAMVVLDTVVRLIPGVLGDEESALHESFSRGILDFPQYTRPKVFRGMEVPEVLLSGNHAEIEKWRQDQAFLKTKKRRPDLLNDSLESETLSK